MTFSERITRRRQLWWDRPRWLALGPRGAVHRYREHWTFRSRDDADEAWRCCRLWQRTLLNKWNSREFAARHGCRTPTLYWRGADPARAPLASLPEQFVVRPVWGAARSGVLVVTDGRDLLRNGPVSRSTIRARLVRPRRFGRRPPLLIEEFVRSEDGQYRLPTEYKCHTFGATIAAVEVIDRTGVVEGAHRYYTAGWEPFADPMHVGMPQADVKDPPRCLAEMLADATRLGVAFGTYVRVDFFAGDRGAVFNELSSTPFNGRDFTAYCDAFFGALWTEKFPDAS